MIKKAQFTGYWTTLLIVILVNAFFAPSARCEEKITSFCMSAQSELCNELINGASQSFRDDGRFLTQDIGFLKQMAAPKNIDLSLLKSKEDAINAGKILNLNAILMFSIGFSAQKDFPLHLEGEIIPITSKIIIPRRIIGVIVNDNPDYLKHFGYCIALLAIQKKVMLSADLPDSAPKSVKDLRDRYFKWRRGEAVPRVFTVFHIDASGKIDFVHHAGSYESKLVEYVFKRIKKDQIWEPARRERERQHVYGFLETSFKAISEAEMKLRKEAREKAAQDRKEKNINEKGLPSTWLDADGHVTGLLIVK